jgi:membrane-anchored protein YejM (alkaline phosphatase superfamily)
VYEKIVLEQKPGVYHGDASRDNQEVYNLAVPAITEMVSHTNFIAFIQFHDPDKTGHVLARSGSATAYNDYMSKALEVDTHIANLMTLLPANTNVIYCSDHGFDFQTNGDSRNHHDYSPRAMLTSSVPFTDVSFTSQMSTGRLIYTLAGGNPDHVKRQPWNVKNYKMWGDDLIA